MERSPVHLQIAGENLKVLSTVDEEELYRLADIVNAKLNQVHSPNHPISLQTALLAMITLAHDLENERNRYKHLSQGARELLEKTLQKIDSVLELEKNSAHDSS